jgi:oligopeptide/dipeptide ABC transporter ATP-binding protein
MADTILEISGLRTYYRDENVVLKAVDGIDLKLEAGTILGIVGESGSGKSTLALSILGLVPYPGSIEAGQVLYRGRDIRQMSSEELRAVRGNEISMIFQDPIAGLNPVLAVGPQIEEIITSHTNASREEARQRSYELLAATGLPEPERVAERYPHQLSGGMAQRVMIAIATALQPSILIADEPTSALDMTIQAQILDELRRLQQKGVTIILITHDLGVIARLADRVMVMYAGRLAEVADVEALYHRPRHPYTWSLLGALPRVNEGPGHRLRQVRGRPPDLTQMPPQCAFVPRCPKVLNDCRVLDSPPLVELEPGHLAACYNPVYQAEGDDVFE